ncbi:MAG: PAS domain S-box protein [Nitrospirae bacterium]|nr:PAS domain S-box protein [Nitrospirota bacterium]
MIRLILKPFQDWGLAKRISAGVGLLLFILPLLLGLFVIEQDRKVLDEELKKRGIGLAERVSLPAVDHILHDDIWELYKLIRDITKISAATENIALYAMVLDNSGKILVHSDPLSVKLGEPIKDSVSVGGSPNPDSLLSKGILIREIRLKEESLYEISSLILRGDERLGITRIGITKRYMEEQRRRLRRDLFIASFILGASGAIVGFLIARQMIRPLNQLTRSVAALGDEQFDKDIKDIMAPVRRRDEVGLLADSFNMMIQRLKKSRKELKESEERHRSLWEHVEDSMIRVTLEKKIIAVNRRVEEVIGYPREEIAGSDISIMIPDKYCDLFDEVFQRTLKKGEKAPTIEIEVLTRDKGLISMELDMRGVTIRDEVESIQIHFRDISKRKEIEQELINAARFVTIGELTTDLTHEINNPIGIISGFAQQILAKMDEGNPSYKFVRIISEEAKRCKNVMKDLLAFSQPSSFQYSLVNPEDLINESLEFVLLLLHQKELISVKKEIQDNLPRLYLDIPRMKGVFLNIYMNAVDAMPQGGDLITQASLDGSYIKIAVSDTGKGIPEDYLDKVFTPYLTTKEGGSGIGLSISKRIVEAHNGRIEIENRLEGGARCLIWLPSHEGAIK